MAAIFWWMKQQWGKQLSPWQKEYRKLFHALRKRGLSVNPAQSPSYVIARAGQTWPEKREAFDVWLEIYTRLAYGWVEDVHAECKALKHAWPLRSWSALAGLREGGV
jgi:hypothetical protein